MSNKNDTKEEKKDTKKDACINKELSDVWYALRQIKNQVSFMGSKTMNKEVKAEALKIVTMIETLAHVYEREEKSFETSN